MRNLTKFTDVVRDGRFGVYVAGNPETGEFVLLDLDGDNPTEAVVREFFPGSVFVGVIAVDANGEAQSAVDVPLSVDAAKALSQAYACHVENTVRAFVEMPQIANA
ncbi:MAG TPA: hypothetical protein VK608_14580 [Edaphobacter sp.]|nr:hypothetical protein [Edaphobacter sp.]